MSRLFFFGVGLESAFFMCIGLVYCIVPHVPGQSYLFLGPSVPWALPWVSPPFASIVTQLGLEANWPKIMLGLRGVGVVYFLAGLGLRAVWRSLERLRVEARDVERTREKRGPAVHEKVSSIEKREQQQLAAGGKATRAKAPALWVIALLHVAFAAGNRYLYTGRPFGVEFTHWCTSTAACVHLLMATNLVAAQIVANRMCKTINAAKVE